MIKINFGKKNVDRCPNCGINYEYIKKYGKLGCEYCYKAFRDRLIPIIENLHNSTIHVGKRPIITDVTSEEVRYLSRLRLALEDAIQKEEYEKAAILRDEIKELEKRLDAHR